jgi:uncharacterized membrane protein
LDEEEVMESRAKFLGHPVHPMLIVFPLGLFISAVLFDIMYHITGNELLPVVAFYNIGGGLLGGIAASVFGFVDFMAIPAGTRARRIAIFHAVGNLTVILFFFFSWLIRMNVPGLIPELFAQSFSFLGIVIAAFTAWLGGELVDRLGVGVDRGAHLNAPSSLSREPASSYRSGQKNVPVTGEDQEGYEP